MRGFLCIVALAACKPPLTPTEPSPSSTPGPGGVLVATPAPPRAPDDPRLVRCGVDDGPRDVLSARLGESGGRKAKRAPPSEEMAPPSLGPPSRPSRRPPPPPPSGPATHLSVGTAHDVAGTALDPAHVLAGRALLGAFETCLPLAGDADLVEQSLQITLSGSGDPLWVLPTLPSPPSKLGRCVLEQSCRYRVSSSLGSRTVWVPVKVFRDPPPPLPTPRPTVAVSVTMDGAGDLIDVGRAVLESAGRACAGQARLLRETRFTVRLAKAGGAEISSSSPDGSAPAMDELVNCTVAQIQARIPRTARGAGFSGVVRWEP